MQKRMKLMPELYDLEDIVMEACALRGLNTGNFERVTGVPSHVLKGMHKRGQLGHWNTVKRLCKACGLRIMIFDDERGIAMEVRT